jgi:hypothetical protein
VPRDGDFYVCGPSTFMSDLSAGLAAWGVAPGCIHTEILAQVLQLPQALLLHRARCRTCRQGFQARDRWSHLPVAVSMFAGDHRSRVCSSWPKSVTYLCDGHVGQESAIRVRPALWPERSATVPIRSKRQRTATC